MSALEMETYPFGFLWIELTNRCNLHCVHCYAGSSPTGKDAVLSEGEYLDLIKQAADLGCRKVQFIGGEPTLNPSLPALIRYARNCGMEFVEVYTNARRIPETLFECLVEYKVNIAASFYSNDESIHDNITQVQGSHRSTVANLRRLAQAELPIRIGIIEMSQNAASIPETMKFVEDLGIKEYGTDRVRKFGRANVMSERAKIDIKELCGSCWQGNLCVHPDGTVSPCIMSKAWCVGSILDVPLDNILQSAQLRDIRERIYREVWLPANPVTTEPYSSHNPPCDPTCHPRCSPSCQPCWPFGKCRPQTGSISI